MSIKCETHTKSTGYHRNNFLHGYILFVRLIICLGKPWIFHHSVINEGMHFKLSLPVYNQKGNHTTTAGNHNFFYTTVTVDESISKSNFSQTLTPACIIPV